MMQTYSLSGPSIRQLASSQIIEYFSIFGQVFPRLVKGPHPCVSMGCQGPVVYGEYDVMISFLSMTQRSEHLIGHLHSVGNALVCASRIGASEIHPQKLYIRYLKKNIRKQDIFGSLGVYGSVLEVKMFFNEIGKFKGIAMATFADPKSVEILNSLGWVVIGSKRSKVDKFFEQKKQPYQIQETRFSRNNFLDAGRVDQSRHHLDLMRSMKTPQIPQPEKIEKKRIELTGMGSGTDRFHCHRQKSSTVLGQFESNIPGKKGYLTGVHQDNQRITANSNLGNLRFSAVARLGAQI